MNAMPAAELVESCTCLMIYISPQTMEQYVQVTKVVMSSVVEVEIGALYINVAEAVYIRQILLELCHLQK